MAALKTVKSKSLRVTVNKDGKTSSKSYGQVGTAATDDNILAVAKAIGSIIAYPVEGMEIVTTEMLKETV